MNKFMFRPVGQGLFYTGSLLNLCYNFVYDCGTENNRSILKKEIRNYKYQTDFCNGKQRPIIDFVVISHLHKDHYCGLYELIKNFTVNKIYLPYFDNVSSDVLRLHLYYDLIIKTDGIENRRENVLLYEIMVSLYDLNEGNIKFYQEYIKQVQYIKCDETVLCPDSGDPYWKFQFFLNGTDKAKIEKINKKCRILLNNSNCKNMEDFISQNEKNIKLIENAYKQIFGQGNQLNNTSVLLLHYPVNETNDLSYFNYNNFGYINHVIYPDPTSQCGFLLKKPSYGTTLLTGDIKFNNVLAKKIKQHFNKVLSVLQIPHHGSKSNWTALCKYCIDAETYIINFGYGNKYRHPNTLVINDLTSRNKEFYCATQNQGFVYYIY